MYHYLLKDISRLLITFPVGKYQAPAPASASEFEALKELINKQSNPSETLKPPTSFLPLSERIVAAESCQFVSQVLFYVLPLYKLFILYA